MWTRRKVLGTTAAAMLSGCAQPKEVARRYTGPEITHIEVQKANRAMHLWSNGEVLKTYEINLGFAPAGPKEFEGDGKTPEGQYFIDRRNPQSQYYLSLGISYPNARDVVRARAAGRHPGNNIFIHGEPKVATTPDWTAGCIALSNGDMREVFWMVPLWTPITLKA